MLVGLSLLVAVAPVALFFTLYHSFPPLSCSLFSLSPPSHLSSHPRSLPPFSLLCLDEWFSKGKILL